MNALEHPNRPALLNAEPKAYSPQARAILERFADVTERPLGQSELFQQIGDFQILIVRLGLRVDGRVIGAADKLRAIVSATTGLDHIDLEAASSRGIAVLNLSGEEEFLRTVPASSEHTWALLLALVRRLPWAFDSVRLGQWDRDRFRGHDLKGRCLGIVGLGRIGRQVVQYGLAFGMKIWAFDPHSQAAWPPRVDRAQSLPELLRRADVLSLHLPLNAETRYSIGRAELSLLPQGAVLINTARGPLLDSGALLEALQSGRLAGAALDVLEGEPFLDLDGHPLVQYARSHPGLLLTPHLGGATVESMAMTEVFMAGKLEAWWQAQQDAAEVGAKQ